MFKEQIGTDVAKVFFNLDEFAEINIINNSSIPSILDDSDYQEYKPGNQYDNDGVFMQLVTLFVNKDDLGYIPVVDEQMTVNKIRYYVIAASENMGVLEIKLREYLA